MLSEFAAYFPLESGTLDQMWNEGLIVLDTNVLLRLYRYKATSAEELLRILDKLGDKIWLPNQVAWEYNRRRLTKINEAESSYHSLIQEFSKAADKTRESLRAFKHLTIHPHVDLEQKVELLIQDVSSRLGEIQKEYESKPTSEHYSQLHRSIGALFTGKVGPAIEAEALKVLCVEGQNRFDRRMPPGLRDVPEKQKNPQRSHREVFGDFIIWHEIVQKAKETKKPTIFVTEDTKDDWWLKDGGLTLGPLPELREEFINTVGRDVQFYRMESFIQEAARRIQEAVSPATVADIRSQTVSETEDAHVLWRKQIEKFRSDTEIPASLIERVRNIIRTDAKSDEGIARPIWSDIEIDQNEEDQADVRVKLQHLRRRLRTLDEELDRLIEAMQLAPKAEEDELREKMFRLRNVRMRLIRQHQVLKERLSMLIASGRESSFDKDKDVFD